MGEPGVLLGAGRASDIFALGGGRVLRRLRSPGDTVAEAAVMQHARSHGFPAPEVYEVTATEMVMDRVDGPTMLDEIIHDPGGVQDHAAVLAALHRLLEVVPAPCWLRRPFPDGDRLVHLDLHPGNVILSAGDPMVIDWTNAAAGPPGADSALVWLLARVAIEVRSPETAGRAEVLESFLAAFLDRIDFNAARATLPTLATMRLHDPNMTAAEKSVIRTLVPAAAG